MFILYKRHRYLLSLLSGLLMVLSFPFTGSLTPLVFVSWVPLLFLENYIEDKRYRSGKIWIHAYLTFLIYNIGTTWWIWNASPGGAIFAFVLNALIMSLTFFVSHLIKKRLNKTERIFVFPTIWLSFEFLHYHWELSWPWLNFGNTFSTTPAIVQWFSVTGVLGGTLWILILNMLFTKVLWNRLSKGISFRAQKRALFASLLVVVIPVFISLIQYYTYTEKIDPLETVVLQPNIDPYNEKFVSSLEEQLDKLCDLADQQAGKNTDIVIAPETAISWGFYEEDLTALPFYHYLLERKQKWGDASFYTGASTARYFEFKNSRASRKLEDGPGYIESYNSSLLLENEGDFSFLHKSKLVLGVEKIPFSDWLPFLEQLSINNGGTSGTLGIEKEPRTLKARNVTFAPVICYESIYGGFIAEQCKKGAQAIFIITNDGWWKDTPGYKQHMSFARLRAIETRRSVARSANTGTSCFIDQRGNVIQKTSWWQKDVIKEIINKNNDITLYVLLGDVIGKISLYLSIGLILYAFYISIRKLTGK